MTGATSCSSSPISPIRISRARSRSTRIPMARWSSRPIRQHLGNFRQTDFMAEFKFREEGLPYDPAFSSASFSPYAVADGIRPDVADPLGLGLARWRRLCEWRHRALSHHAATIRAICCSAPGITARASTSRRGEQSVEAGFSAARRGAALLRHLSDGPRHRPARGGADPLFLRARARRGDAARKLAADRGADATLSRAG